MDDLDQQLAHLQLMNARDLPPKALHGGNSGGPPPGLVKKVGPAVPPKPIKKPQQQQPTSTSPTNNPLPPPPPPPTSQQSATTPTAQANAPGHNVYSNISLTLDNPAVLEQKLEALEHHKRVLENQHRAAMASAAAGGLHHQQKQHHHGYGGETGKIYENQQQLYENMKLSGGGGGGGNGDVDGGAATSNYANYRRATGGAPKPVSGGQQQQQHQQQLYGNLPSSGMGSSMYSNYSAYNNGDRSSQDDLPPPPAPHDHANIPPVLNLMLNTGDAEYLATEDDLPPPPSPVSSSYSELRRATDHHHHHLHHGHMHSAGGADGGAATGNYQHLNNGMSSAAGAGQHHHLHHQQQQQQQHHQQQQHQQHNGDPMNGGGPNATYANNYVAEYGDYAGSLPGSSTYESIYEPINPRPPSQMSSRSNYSLYNPYVSGPQGAGGVGAVSLPPGSNGSGSGGVGGPGSAHRHHAGKTSQGGQDEAEVDILTDLLVQSMDGGAGNGGTATEPGDSYGVCVQCGERVVGESSGCTAMEQIYHITCFTCCQCQINLQGKPFYALDGKPCCEEDYLNTLEKCSVCMKPILERILRATGKPYHPCCFCCVVCGKSLDGVPFTVDATNQNHCIEDFHKKFAPRCCVCKQPILPEQNREETVRVVALDRSFHVSCYKCEDCGLLLSSEAEGRGCFPLDDHILCKSCNAKRVQTLTSHMSTEL